MRPRNLLREFRQILKANLPKGEPHELRDQGIIVLGETETHYTILVNGHEGDEFPEGEVLSKGKFQERHNNLPEEIKFQIFDARIEEEVQVQLPAPVTSARAAEASEAPKTLTVIATQRRRIKAKDVRPEHADLIVENVFPTYIQGERRDK